MKLFLKLSALFITITIAIVITIVAVVDPNDYKQQIQDQVSKNLNRELSIAGELSWSLYPILGIKIGETELYNPPAFSEKVMLSVQESALSIQVLPLLSGKIEVGQIILDGVNINLITNADGVSNLDDLGPIKQTEQAQQQEQTPEDSTESSQPLQLSSLKLSGISITNTHLAIIDHSKKEQQKLTIDSFSVGEFAFDKPTPISLTSHFKNNQLDTSVQLDTELLINKALTKLTLHGFKLNSKLISQALLGTEINSELRSELIYQLDKQNLAINQFKLHHQLTGELINGDIHINVDNIEVTEQQKLTLNKLSLLTELSGSALQGNKVKASLNSQLTADIKNQSVNISQFDFDKQVTGKDIDADIKLSLQGLNVKEFKQIIIKQLALNAVLKSEQLPGKKLDAVINSDVSYDLAKQKLSLSALDMQLNKFKLGGKLSVVNSEIPQIRYSLKGNVWDVNPYLASKQQQPQTVATAPDSPSEEQQPDLSILKQFDINGDLTLDGLLYEDIKIGRIFKRVIVKNGKAQLKPLNANLYGGNLSMNASIDEAKGKNRYNSTTKVNKVQIMPLLKDAAKIDILSGTANFNINAKGSGLIPSQIQKQLQAKGDFKITDGELYGVNIPKEIRLFKAKLTGKKLPADKQVKKTDFASLIGQFTLSDGIANNQKLVMLSPVMRLDGTGQSDTIKQTINYKLGVTPLDKSDENTDYLDLSGVTIPLVITGTYTEPKFKLDTDGAVKAQIKANKKKLKKKAQKVLEDKIKDSSNEQLKEEAKKLEDQFKSLFR